MVIGLPYKIAILLAKEELKDRLEKRKQLWEACGQYRGRIPVWFDELKMTGRETSDELTDRQ